VVALEVGFDGGQSVKSQKRHLLVDPLGLPLMVAVTAANVSDQQDARQIFTILFNLTERTRRLIII
jgi:hypothetical protein